MKKIIFLFFILTNSSLLAQVTGNISDSFGNPLSFVSIYLEKNTLGTTSNDAGDYILNIKKPGNYTILFQFLGYKTLKKTVFIKVFPFVLNATLEEESIVLEAISISSKDNPANTIIRNTIASKEKNTNKLANYTANFYSRGLTKIKNAPESFLGMKTGDFGGGLDSTRSGIVYLSETISEITSQKKPKKFKEKIIASKVSGKDNGVSFNRAEESNINLYENSIPIFNDLISPISTNAFGYYNYRLEGTFYDENRKLINKIQIIPKRKGARVFEGHLYVVEDDWALYGAELTTNGAQIGLPMVNSLKLKQSYAYSSKIDLWTLRTQTIDFDIQLFGFKPRGKFSYVYTDYKISPKSTKKTFTNEVLTFEKEATKKDTVYWKKIRPVPLTMEEVNDYALKDSLKIIRKSKKYLDSLDATRNTIGWMNPIMGYTYRNSYKDWNLSYGGPLARTNFNPVQGFHTSVEISYFKRLNEYGKWWNSGINLNYGFSDQKFRPSFFFNKKWNNISRPKIGISGGITTAQFNNRNPILPLNNSVSTLFRKNSYLKIYEKTFAKIDYSEEIRNGIYLNSSLEYANRKPLYNTTNFSFKYKNVSYSSNNPLDDTNFVSAPFQEHEIAILNLGARFVIGQKYLSYPHEKENLGNDKYPSLHLNYRKTFGAENSELNSDALTGRVTQNVNAGNYGRLSYNIRGGIFLEKKNIAFMDYFQPNGNQFTFPLDISYINSFGLLHYYEIFSNDRYAEMHLQHEFRGAILGKIPGINLLNLQLVTGGKALFTADRKPYSEYSIGLNNIGWGKWRFLRVDYVRSNFGGIQRSDWLFGLSMFN
ncbi:DUF5686 and carboxypeptidase regulatory-like domain-containing protein [Polaribacter sp. HL-MS24]|uniref:DUF5686 and carboxypeptidase regulatory-like domain-containing protein n=1 Tax=Polaribacter sp. HL-MS24 TaxID=3077735 RepID=UPI0029345E7C|nr:DUF5686 and carboxypeptidase regulatory-like domain-containing protein [Polaribacter sp. HL-MS24]WOC40976.1 DUF5686 and carboxypeptidase regulatory-like domain-containing protein [Polaribacter sp. HL-MS24]